MKPIAFALVLLAAASPFVEATTVSFQSTNSGVSLYEPTGTNPLPNGDLIRVGTFATPNNLSLGLSVAQIESQGGWTEFGTLLTTHTTNVNKIGKVSGSLVDDSAAASFFDNKPLYIWAFDSSTTSGASATGIFRATSGTANWVFPQDTNDLNDSRGFVMDELSMNSVMNIGSRDPLDPALYPNKLLLSNFAAVPEVSSTAMLYGLAACFFFGTQRLRRRTA